MTQRTIAALFATVAFLGIGLQPVAAQGTFTTDESGVARLADGRPDLQGVWDFRSTVPFERRDPEAEQAREDARTSLIADPPDGRLPPLMPATEHQVGSYAEAYLPAERPIRYRGGDAYANGPEDRGLAERCILGFISGPPVRPGGYNQNLQVFQTSDHVVIYNEMVHNARVVPLDGRPHLPDDIRQWTGDSRGYWDGDTLVIESTNFSDKVGGFNVSSTSALGDGRALHLTECLQRRDAVTLEYEFTVTHPNVFTRPFTSVVPMTKSDLRIFEYACHEGNYGLAQILLGTRMEERSATETVK